MDNKLSYAELEQRIKDLEVIAKKSEESQRDSDARFRNILENSFDLVYRLNLKTDRFDYISPSSKLLGYDPEEMRELGFARILEFVHPDDRDRLNEGYNILADSEDKSSSVEFRLKHWEGGFRWVSDTRSLVRDDNGEPLAVVGTIRDISKQKQVEEELRKVKEQLESKVKERTASLEEANIALRVLLRRREEDLKEIEEKLQLNVKELVAPYIDSLSKSGLDENQQAYLDIMESNLDDIVSPFVRSLSTHYLKLTHAEVEVANLVKQGKATKEIAELLNMSPRTIDTHRYNIRKKLGLKSKKSNLRNHLLSFQ